MSSCHAWGTHSYSWVYVQPWVRAVTAGGTHGDGWRDGQQARLLRLWPTRPARELLHEQREELSPQQRVGGAVAQPLLCQLIRVVGLLDTLI